MNNVFKALLIAAAVVLAWMSYQSVMTPIEFNEIKDFREKQVFKTGAACSGIYLRPCCFCVFPDSQKRLAGKERHDTVHPFRQTRHRLAGN